MILTQFESNDIFLFNFIVVQKDSFEVELIEFHNKYQKIVVESEFSVKEISKLLLEVFSTKNSYIDETFLIERDSINYCYRIQNLRNKINIHENSVKTLKQILKRIIET